MSTIKRARPARAPESRNNTATFEFPSSHHLNVVTSKHVHAICDTDTRILFTSGSQGIVSAKEGPIGAGHLAFSDSHNVVIHQIEHGLDRSYRLKGAEGCIRLLEFSADSKVLFFTTTLLNAVQAYSISEANLVEPGPVHASLPTVIAISQSSHMLLTASEQPPVVYLQNRELRTRPLLLKPLASETSAVKASFHPSRPDMFLLAFEDGTLGAYDAAALSRDRREHDAYPQAIGGELCTFKCIHKVSTTSSRAIRSDVPSLSITGVKFLPGYRARAVTCGADGKCHVLDFERQAIVRSWHVRAPASSLSIIQASSKRPCIAVGKIDGKVSLYDTSGNVLHELLFGSECNPAAILDIEWVHGKCPRGIDSAAEVQKVEETSIELYTVAGTLRSRKTVSGSQSRRRSVSFDLAAADGSVEDISESSASASGTVCRRSPGGARGDQGPKVFSNDYMDLFSPVKVAKPSQNRSPPRPRPRISSMTFVNDSNPGAPPSETSEGRTGATQVGDAQGDASIQQADTLHAVDNGTTEMSNLSIMAGFRKQPTTSAASRPGSLALFAPYLPAGSTMGTTRKKPTSQRRVALKASKHSAVQEQRSKIGTQGCREVAPDSLVHADKYDIWLTDDLDEEEEEEPVARRGARKMGRLFSISRAAKATSPMPNATRASIELQMSPPRAKVFDNRHNVEAVNHPQIRRVSHTTGRSESLASNSTRLSSTDNSTTVDEDVADEGVTLRPGFAQSFHGPVSVDRYLPRRSSLAFPSSPVTTGTRSTLQQIAGNEVDIMEGDEVLAGHDEKTCKCCTRLQAEIDALKEELAELRRLVKGKDRGT